MKLKLGSERRGLSELPLLAPADAELRLPDGTHGLHLFSASGLRSVGDKLARLILALAGGASGLVVGLSLPLLPGELDASSTERSEDFLSARSGLVGAVDARVSLALLIEFELNEEEVVVLMVSFLSLIMPLRRTFRGVPPSD